MKTGVKFERIPFKQEDAPLRFWPEENSIFAMFEIGQETLPYAEEWFGVDIVQKRGDRYIAEVLLPADKSLLGRILSVDGGFKVLSPASLAERGGAGSGAHSQRIPRRSGRNCMK